MTNLNGTNVNNDNPFNTAATPMCMKDFGQKTKLVMETFKKCTEEIKFENNDFMTLVVRNIKEQRNIFRKFVQGSMKFSDKFSEYSTEILYFAECFKNNKYSDHDFLDLLNALLVASKENSRLTKELKNILAIKESASEPERPEETDSVLEDIEIIEKDFSYSRDLDKITKSMGAIINDVKTDKPGDSGIKNDLIDIQNCLQRYANDVKENPYTIDSDNQSKIKEQTAKIEVHSKHAVVSSTIGFAALVGMIILIAVPTGGVAIPVAPAIALVSVNATSDLYSLARIFKIFQKQGIIDNLERQLVLEAKELCKRIESFSDNLSSISLEISELEAFWESQIEQIDYLIANLTKLNTGQRAHKDMIVNRIEQKWKDVHQECQFYSRMMKESLIKDEIQTVYS